MPVYNSEKFIEQAIDSILSQTFRDFELIICDNASTDRTRQICERYVKADPRVQYHRNKTNIGPAENHNNTVRLSRGEFFRWAAYDDVLAPEYLRECVHALDCFPDVILCHCTEIEIDEHGSHIRTVAEGRRSCESPYERFRELTKLDHDCEEIYGLVRSDTLRKTKLHQSFTDSDRNLISELGLYGRFHYVPKPLFFRRVHSQSSTKIFPNWRERMVWFDSSVANRFVCPHWLQFFDYLRIVHESPISFSNRVRCSLHMARWVFAWGHGKRMLKDIAIALAGAAHRISQPWNKKWQIGNRFR